MNIIQNETHKVVEYALKRQEAILMGELKELISRGIIVVEQRAPILTQSYLATTGETKIELSWDIKLVPKEKEYIEKLEKIIEDLKGRIRFMDKLNDTAMVKLAIQNTIIDFQDVLK